MSIEQHGGPAFPAVFDVRYNPEFATEHGMTLRDYFAAAVVTGISFGLFGEIAANGMPQALAKHAYLIADAMLMERAK